MEVKKNMCIHFICVADNRMICQGFDGLSRGNMMEELMTGENMLCFILISIGATKVEFFFHTWIGSWWMLDLYQRIILLEPRDWFLRGYDITSFKSKIDGVVVPKLESGYYDWDLSSSC